MNKIKVILCGLSFLFLSGGTKLLCQTTTKEITDGFFALYPKDQAKAVGYAFSTNSWMLKKPEEVAKVKTQLKSLTDLLGDYYGYDLISDNSISPNYKVIKYLVRYNREPIKFTFLMYKAKDKWMVQNFSWNENMDKEMEDAPKTPAK